MGTGIVEQFVVKITGDSEGTQNFLATDKINSSSNTTLTVGGLEADSTYRFQVAAMNDIGIGPFSEMSDEITTGKGDYTHIYCSINSQKILLCNMLQSFKGEKPSTKPQLKL